MLLHWTVKENIQLIIYNKHTQNKENMLFVLNNRSIIRINNKK